MKYNINIDELIEIYLICNTSSFLFEKFSSDNSIQFLSREFGTQELIISFQEIATQEIEKLEDLVYAYSIYTAIILKNDNSTFNFLKTAGKVDFEWFIDLRSIYFARLKSLDVFSFEGLNHNTKASKIILESSDHINNQTIEFA